MEMSEQEEKARAILVRADQEVGLETLVREDDRDLLPFAIKSPGDYLAWLLIAAGRAEEEAGDPYEDAIEERTANYVLALACYKFAIDLLLIGIIPTKPTCIKCKQAEPTVYQRFCQPCFETVKAEFREEWQDVTFPDEQAFEDLVLSFFVDEMDEPLEREE